MIAEVASSCHRTSSHDSHDSHDHPCLPQPRPRRQQQRQRQRNIIIMNTTKNTLPATLPWLLLLLSASILCCCRCCFFVESHSFSSHSSLGHNQRRQRQHHNQQRQLQQHQQHRQWQWHGRVLENMAFVATPTSTTTHRIHSLSTAARISTPPIVTASNRIIFAAPSTRISTTTTTSRITTSTAKISRTTTTTTTTTTTLHLKFKTFDEMLDHHENVPLLIDFYAPWCGPCRVRQ